MLHGALPRAYLAPGLGYFGGYYGEELHPGYPGYLPLDEPYGPRALPTPWEPASPLPLDLSLKPHTSCSSVASSPRADDEAIEVDDEEDRKDRVQRRLDTKLSARSSSDDEFTRLPGFPETTKYQGQKVTGYPQQFLLTPQPAQLHAPMTPPSTPSPPQCPRRRPKDDPPGSPGDAPPAKQLATDKVLKKRKHVARRLKFDEDTSSPVSGTVILGPDEAVVTGDIDPAFNVVEVTEEARAELAKIENRLGPYQCKLCRQLYEDAFQLAQHRCSRIAHVEYRCPECDKRFSCPANLASHRRWHKPRVTSADAANALALANLAVTPEIACAKCDAKFTRQTALRKHISVQHAEANNNNNNVSVNGDEGGEGGEAA